MKQIYLMISIAFMLTLTNCGVDLGPTFREEIPVAPFHKIEIKADVDVFIQQDNWLGVIAEGQDEVLSRLEFEVSNEKLTIRDIGNLRGPASIYIHVPFISRIEHDCHGSIYGQNFFVLDSDLEIISTKRGDIDLAISCPSVTIKQKSKGDIILEGEVGYLDLRVSDEGDFLGGDLFADDARIRMLDSGDAEVFVRYALDARINDVGNIYYRGNPEIFIDGNGSGELINSN